MLNEGIANGIGAHLEQVPGVERQTFKAVTRREPRAFFETHKNVDGIRAEGSVYGGLL